MKNLYEARKSKHGLFSLLTSSSQIIATISLSIGFARTMTPYEFGLYATVYAMTMVTAIAGQFGLSEYILRETASLRDHCPAKLIGMWAKIDKIEAGSILLSLVAGGGLLLATLSDWSATILLVAGVGAATFSVLSSRCYSLRPLDHPVLAQALNFLFPTIISLVFLGIFIFSGMTITPIVAIAIHGLGNAICLVIVSIIRNVKSANLQSITHGIPETHDILRDALPMAMTTIMQTVTVQVDIVMLSFLASTTDAGFYRVAIQGGMLAATLVKTLSGTIAPRIPTLYKSGLIRDISEICRKTSLASTIIATTIFGAWLLIGKWALVTFYGPGFEVSYYPLILLAFSQVVASSFGMTGIALNMIGMQSQNLKVSIISLCCKIFLNILLIPYLGVLGASISFLASISLWNFLGWHILKTKAGINISVYGKGNQK